MFERSVASHWKKKNSIYFCAWGEPGVTPAALDDWNHPQLGLLGIPEAGRGVGVQECPSFVCPQQHEHMAAMSVQL